jgi:hypothetical protein
VLGGASALLSIEAASFTKRSSGFGVSASARAEADSGEATSGEVGSELIARAHTAKQGTAARESSTINWPEK